MYLLDTNVISEFRKTKPHGAVIAWLRSVGSNDLFIPAVVIGEMQAGVERTRLQAPEKADGNRAVYRHSSLLVRGLALGCGRCFASGQGSFMASRAI